MRHPFEVAAIVAFWLIGVLGLYGAIVADRASSAALSRVLPDAMLIVWLLGLIIAATLGAVAAALAVREPITALLCERLFLVGIGGFAVIYVAALLARTGWESSTPVIYFGVYAVAAFWRLWQVHRYLRWRLAQATEGSER